MSATFDIDVLKQRLETLSAKQRIAFAASCCERLLPNYYAFAAMEKWGNAALLRKALDEVWGLLKGRIPSRDRVEQLIAECERVIPDTEDFCSASVSAALDAGVCIIETLHCCLDGDAEHAVTVASQARDTVHMYVQARDDVSYSDPEWEQRIFNDPLMIEELEKQEQDLKDIESTCELTAEFLDRLRESSSASGLRPPQRNVF